MFFDSIVSPLVSIKYSLTAQC